MFRMKCALQHSLNPLHIYCRLVPLLGRKMAMAFIQGYEPLYARVL